MGRKPHLDLERAVARVALQGAAVLETFTGEAVPRRRLANYLRGNQLPPHGAQSRGSREPPEAYGLLWGFGAAWIEELIERLLEEGYLSEAPGPGSKVALTASGRRLLADREQPPPGLLPRRPHLGTNPRLEEKLRQLRRRLAQEAGRPPYGIFSNASLAHLAARPPRNLGELAAVPGFGEERLRKYGRRVLAVLKR